MFVPMPVDPATNVRILVTLPHELRKEIAIVRRDRGICESEAIRRLVRSGLEVYRKAANQRQRHPPRDADANTGRARVPISDVAHK
jgi:hypothetical protein